MEENRDSALVAKPDDGMYLDEMTCVCGEVLTGLQRPKSLRGIVPELGNLARQFRQHMLRPDHQASGAQWIEAGARISKAKDNARTANQPSS